MTNREYKYRAKLVAEAGIKKQEQQRMERGFFGWECRYGMYKFGKIVKEMESIIRSVGK
jgi:hypothetical protein